MTHLSGKEWAEVLMIAAAIMFTGAVTVGGVQAWHRWQARRRMAAYAARLNWFLDPNGETNPKTTPANAAQGVSTRPRGGK